MITVLAVDDYYHLWTISLFWCVSGKLARQHTGATEVSSVDGDHSATASAGGGGGGLARDNYKPQQAAEKGCVDFLMYVVCI